MTTKNTVYVVMDDPAWKQHGVDLARIRAAALLVLAHEASKSVRRATDTPGRRDSTKISRVPQLARTHVQLTILLTSDAKLRGLNARFRMKDAATNVLAFPAAGDRNGYIGDVAIALGVTAAEATKAGVSVQAHTLHLAVHGVLHLLGYDHVRNTEAEQMERLETGILKELGVPDPYARSVAIK